MLGTGLLGLSLSAPAQQLIYQEGFNTDGELGTNPRYTTTGRGAYEANQITWRADQLGPIYWAHNFEVSFVGVPGPTAGRRALMAWDPAIADAASISDKTWQLMLGTIKWLAKDKANATVIAYPDVATIGALAEKLTEAGYTLIDDDGTAEAQLATRGDVLIHAGSANPSRGAQAPIGVAVMIAADHDDMLTASIGTASSFQPGDATIATPAHPAAGGVTGSFAITENTYNWQLLGSVLPNQATTIASFVRRITPTVTSLADVDAMIAGTTASTKTTETVQALDFNDGSAGNWNTVENAIPGGAAGVWGLRATGKLNVTAAGTYSFAIGSDDGARVSIDLNRNGLDAGDVRFTDPGPQGHTIRYFDVNFPSTGQYDFQVVAYNSGAGGDVELSVENSVNSGNNDLDTLPEAWSLIGDPEALSAVTASGQITAEAFVPAGDVQEVAEPFIVVLNGPSDTPPGSVFGGGPFTGFEGTGFFGISGGNKFPETDVPAVRTLTLRPVNVAGKSDVKLTIALAATFLDFETSDFLEVWVYPNGLASTPVRLAQYSAPSGTVKYFVDVANGGGNRLGLEFKDVTYDVPAGSTDLVVEIRAMSTWWNEIAAFDNIRITSGSAPTAATLKASKVTGGLKLDIEGGTPPFLVQATLALPTGWIDLVTTSQRSITLPMVGPTAFIRVESGTDKTVKLFTATLNGAAERPAPVTTPAVGAGFLAVNTATRAANSLVYYTGLKQNTTAAHIHGPADVNTATGVLLGLSNVTPASTTGLYGNSSVLTETVFNHINAGNTYFNVHSGAHTGGEIRGQLVAAP